MFAFRVKSSRQPDQIASSPAIIGSLLTPYLPQSRHHLCADAAEVPVLPSLEYKVTDPDDGYR